MGQGQGGPEGLKGWDRPSQGSCRQCVPVLTALFNTEHSLTSQARHPLSRYCLSGTWRGYVFISPSKGHCHNVTAGCSDELCLLFSTPNYQMLTNSNEVKACPVCFQKWQYPGGERARLLKTWQNQRLNFFKRNHWISHTSLLLTSCGRPHKGLPVNYWHWDPLEST